jgi:hypothetical protein
MFQYRLIGLCGLLAVAVVASAQGKGSAAAYPWGFNNGTGTSRATAITTAQQIARRAGYASISGTVAKNAWTYTMPAYGSTPSRGALAGFAKKVKANAVIYGSVSWHTRSIWVGAGPKTISTATVNFYVYDAKRGKTVYQSTGVQGRSDEKANMYKIAADVLLTPLVTIVSGGPATPREQRAVQIAMANAAQKWVKG